MQAVHSNAAAHIPIHAAGASPGCSGCAQGADALPLCRSHLGEACAAPALSGHAWLADRAFHPLRGLLPDTDIYVRHVG